MRKLTLKDILPTLIVAAVVVPFIGYLVRGSMPCQPAPARDLGDLALEPHT